MENFFFDHTSTVDMLNCIIGWEWVGYLTSPNMLIYAVEVHACFAHAFDDKYT